ncbi:MAG: hypothetical protein UY33_C0032G0027 [Candidatus Amesbacteria bacterium GW2011_GWA1_48_9]|uniref:Uncharacterized protein n=1 Tax=Candidatus Amesbacteria bacterium GW2011_GWA1_48_9 TaxID=1618355 RepID=A0A0G1XA09_9BACT|nr:MAG: hypothetical protein UY33_C0032G0027 [Candidatus Amesbacteria bacterium GW2011_GWA1_48_9]
MNQLCGLDIHLLCSIAEDANSGDISYDGFCDKYKVFYGRG